MSDKNKEVKDKLRDSIKLTEGAKLFYEYTYGMGGSFYTNLFDAMMAADMSNLSRLELSFPDEVEAVRRYKNEPGYWEKLQKAWDEWLNSNR